MSQNPPPPQDSGLQFLDLIGQGGFGAVYRAADSGLGRTVAAKVLLDDSSGRERFLAEAMITGNLQHPNIIPVHGLAVDAQGRDYFTMPVVQGRNLQDVIDDIEKDNSAAAFPLPRLVAMLLAVAEAVAYAHARGVVHRDLKPGNIMLGRFGEVFVLDWGIAKLMGHTAPEPPQAERPANRTGKEPRKLAALDSGSVPTLSGSIIGTPGYMSPEQANGDVDSIDFTTDVYALGVILHQILHLEVPDGPSDEHPTPARWGGRRRVPRALAAIANRCRRFARDERYPDANALVSDLRAWLEDRPVSARPDGPLAAGARWLRHHRATAALLIGVVASSVVAGLAILALTSLHQAERAALAERATAAERGERERLQRRAEAMAAYVPALKLLERAEWNTAWAKRAAAALERAVAIDDTFPEAQRALGRALCLAGRTEEAEATMRRANDLMRSILGRDDPGLLRELGMLTWSQKRDFDGGLALLRQAAAADPGDIQARIAQELVRSIDGDPQEAIAGMQALAAEHPDYWEVRQSLGMLLGGWRPGQGMTSRAQDGKRDLAGAVAELDEAIRLRPGYAQLYMQRAMAQISRLMQGDGKQRYITAFYRDLDLAVLLEPDNPEVRFVRMDGYMFDRQNKQKELLDDLDYLAKYLPDNDYVLSRRMRYELALGTGQRLLDDVERALAAKPGDARLQALRAELQQRLAQPSEAVEAKPGF